jgi:hypothetical protein
MTVFRPPPQVILDPELPGSRTRNDFPGSGSDRIHNAASEGGGRGIKSDMKLAQEIHAGRQKKLSNPGAPTGTNYTDLLISENFPRSSFKQCILMTEKGIVLCMTRQSNRGAPIKT